MGFNSQAQKFMTQNGTISFYSKTAVEDIEAVNNQVSSVVDLESGNMAFSLLMKAFTFEKALMQEHFNEKYIESEKYPKATFKGQIIDMGNVKIGTEPTEVKVKGQLTMHGESNEIECVGTLVKKGDQIIMNSTFPITVADYKIKIPSAVEENIAKTVEVKVNGTYEKLQ
jgi:polyisoprenoid-binding protein YceI